MKRLLHMQTASKKSVSEYTRLLDPTNECRRGLLTQDEPVDQWDRWFVTLVGFNLDAATREDWEESFLESKIQALDTAHCPDPEGNLRKPKASNSSIQKTTKSISAYHAAATPPSTRRSSCVLCKAEHRIGMCPTFLERSVDHHWKYAREKGLCFNCLSQKHITTMYQSSFRCRLCQRPHERSYINRRQPPPPPPPPPPPRQSLQRSLQITV